MWLLQSILLVLSCIAITIESRIHNCWRDETKEVTKTYTKRDEVMKWDHQLALALVWHAKKTPNTFQYQYFWERLQTKLGSKIRNEVTMTSKKTYAYEDGNEILLMTIEANIDGVRNLRYDVEKGEIDGTDVYKLLSPYEMRKKLDTCRPLR